MINSLKGHKIRLENNHDVGKIQGKMIDLKGEEKKEDTKKAESI